MHTKLPPSRIVRRSLTRILVAGLLTGAAGLLSAADTDGPAVRTFAARDTLAVPADPGADAQQCLNQLAWKPAAFEVSCRPVSGETRSKFHGHLPRRLPATRSSYH